MVVEFITTCAIRAHHDLFVSSNPIHGEVYSIQQYVIKFVCDRSMVFTGDSGLPQPIKVTAMI